MEIGGTILDALAKLWDHLDPEKNMHTQRLLDVLNEVAVKLKEFILGLNGHLENLLAYGGQEVLNAMGDCFMDLAAAAVNSFGVLIDAVDGLIDHLDPKFNVDTRNMLQATADMFHAVGQAAWDFSELLKSALENGGQDMINAFGTYMVNLGETVARVITTMMESLSAFFEYVDPENNDITRAMMKAWEDAFYAIGDAALQFAELFDSIMGNGGQEVLNKLGDAFNSLVGLVGTVVQEIADALNGLFEHLNPKTNEFTQGMLKAWQDAFDGISELCATIGDVLASAMDNGGQELLNAIGDLAMQIGDTLGTLVEEVANCMSEFFKYMDPGENEIARGAIDAFKYFVDSIRNFVDMLGNAFGTFMDNGGQEFVNNMGDIVALLLDIAATVTADLINSVAAFMDSWAGHMVISTCATALELISEVLKGLLEILEPLTPIISGVIAAIGGFLVAQKVVGFISGIVTVFQTLAGSGGILALAKAGFTALWGVLAANPIAATVAAIVGIGTALVALYNTNDSFKEFIDNILKGFEGLVDKIKEHFSKILEDVREIFGNVIDIITGIFEGDGYKVGEAVRNLITNVLTLIYDLNQSFVEIGWELIKGLFNGIWECVKAIPDFLAGIGDFIVDFFKGLFGIHSPSTVFAELGVNLIEGLIKGIEDTVKSVSDAFEKVKDAAIKVVEKITTEVGKKWDEINKDINKKLTDLKKDISNKWNEIKKTTKERCTEIWEATKEQYGKLKDTVSTSIDKVKEVSSDKWTQIKDKTADIVGKTKEKIEEKYNKLKDNLTNTMDKWRTDSEEKWNKVKDKTSDIIGKIVSDTEKKYSDIKDTLGKKVDEWKESSSKKWTEIKTNTTDIIEKLRTESEDKFNIIKEKLTNKLEEFRTNSSNKWEEVRTNTREALEGLRKDAEDKYTKLKENLGSKVEEIISDAKTKWENFKTDTSTKVSEAVEKATTEYGKIKEKFTKKMDEAKTALGNSWDTIKTSTKTWASQLPGKVTEGLSNLKTKMTKPFEDAKKSIETVISNIGRAFKNANWEMPKIKMPHLKVTGEWSFNPPKVPKFSIEWYKRGGIIDGITPLGFANGALQMGGEAGKEMVVPLEDTSFTSKIAQAMGQAVDNAMARNRTNNVSNSGYNVIDDKRDIVLKINDREFARASINSINKLQRESGRTLLDI